MQPYKRRRRSRRDMITLGGWLFADLLLGLSMLFLVANTVGAPPPEPTPTPLPNYQATAESDIAAANASARGTEEALTAQINALESDQAVAQATQDAEATLQAMSASERATVDAQATEDAVVAQATIEALSTEQARGQTDQAALNNELATTVAEATMVARQLNEQGTQQAELEAQATENAASGVNAQGTTVTLENALATRDAEAEASDQTVANAQATSESAVATSDAAENQVLQAQEQAQLNTLNPNAVPETINVDLNGVLQGDEDAMADARAQLDSVLAPYLQTESCRVGFVLISGGAPDISQGNDLADRIGTLIESEYPQLLPEPLEGEDPALAMETVANVGRPDGQVELLLFMSAGCQPEG